MKRKKLKFDIHSRQGIVMLITLVVLVIMASLGYTLATRVAAQKHRDQYVIDYQTARYACDSGFKFASSMLNDVTFRVIDRPNEPDFSDLFAFTDEQYDKFIAQYIIEKQSRDANESYSYSDDYNRDDANDPNRSTYQRESNMPAYDMNDANFAGLDMNDINNFNDQMRRLREDPNKITIPGPYGPQWPLAAAPMEFEIGNSKIIIEIEDENAKFPIMLGAVTDKETQRKAQTALDTFCEWMVAAAKDKAMTYSEISTLKSDMQDLAKIIDLASDQNSVTAANKEPNNAPAANTRFRSSRRNKRTNTAAANQQTQNPNATQRTATSQYSDFSKMFNSSLVHTEPLAVPYIKSDRRTESAMKYLNRWGSNQINVNSAPRHVLESVFVMGGDAPGVSDQIIIERKIKPFSDVNDLQKRIFRYSDTIQRCKPYLTTQSKFFTVKVTAFSGVASARITAAVLKDGKNVQTIGIISE